MWHHELAKSHSGTTSSLNQCNRDTRHWGLAFRVVTIRCVPVPMHNAVQTVLTIDVANRQTNATIASSDQCVTTTSAGSSTEAGIACMLIGLLSRLL